MKRIVFAILLIFVSTSSLPAKSQSYPLRSGFLRSTNGTAASERRYELNPNWVCYSESPDYVCVNRTPDGGGIEYYERKFMNLWKAYARYYCDTDLMSLGVDTSEKRAWETLSFFMDKYRANCIQVY